MGINPIGTLYNDFIKILNSAIIKYNYRAEEQETLDMRKKVDGYFDALYLRDKFETYDDYSELEMREAGMINENDIINGINDPMSIPKSYRETLLNNRRQHIISTYVETNDYYRMLNGYPNKDDYDYVYIDNETCLMYGISPEIPIHRIEDTLGFNFISTLESIGYIDDLIQKYPEKEYLRHIGSKRISIDVARHAKNFALLYVNPNITDTVLVKFVQLYDQCREYYTNTLYVYEYRTVFDYYDNFIGMCIMVMTMQQLISRSIEQSIKREFFDDYAVQLLYSVYNIPYNSKLDSNTQKAIVRNLNMLIQNKATNKVIYDIASLLGYDRIEIFCYYLMKERKFDSDERPLVVKTLKENEDTGQMEEVYDYERMYDVYFQKVELKDHDYHQALEDQSNRVSYDSVTTADPFWWEDDELYKEVWESEYNFKETKYLGITISYKLTEIMYENIILLRMIMDKKQELEKIMVDLPKIVENGKLNLFDTVVLLCALTCKKYHLKGEIVCKPTHTLHVLDSLNRMYDPESAYDTLSFNFKQLMPENFDDATREIFRYMDEDDKERFMKYVSILSVNGSTPEEKINAINNMYLNVKGLSKFLSAKISAADDIEEYRVYTNFYRAIFYTKATADTFRIKTNDGDYVPQTYLEYIKYMNPSLYEFIETIEDEDLYMFINHVISGMEDVIKNLNYLYLINDSSSSLQEILIELINFFKSYTTDLIGLNIVYIFDFKPDNMLKIIDRIEKIKKTLLLPDSINLSYADYLRIHANINIDDEFLLFDQAYLHANFSVQSKLYFEDILHILQKKIQTDRESFKFTDDLSIHARELLDDFISYRDDVLSFDKRIETREYFKFVETLIMTKLVFYKERVGLYDTTRMRAQITTGSDLKLRDKCMIIRHD